MIQPFVDPALLVVGALVLLAVVVAGAVSSSVGRRRGWFLRALVVMLLVLIALGPGWGRIAVATRPSDLEVLVVMDRTTSMSAQDWNGTEPRLEGARTDIDALMKALPGSRFTVVTFGKDVTTALPSTSDASFVAESLALIPREEPFAGHGSLVDRPLVPMRTRLTELRRAHPDRRRIVVLMTDGENTAAGPQQSFAPLAPLVDAGAVLGYGTAAGGLMPLDEKHPSKGWVTDPSTGQPARSHVDGENLRKVARQLQVPYLHRTSPGGLEEIAKRWQQRFSTRVADGAGARAKLPLGWLVALVLLAVVALDLRTHWRGFWQARRELS